MDKITVTPANYDVHKYGIQVAAMDYTLVAPTSTYFITLDLLGEWNPHLSNVPLIYQAVLQAFHADTHNACLKYYDEWPASDKENARYTAMEWRTLTIAQKLAVHREHPHLTPFYKRKARGKLMQVDCGKWWMPHGKVVCLKCTENTPVQEMEYTGEIECGLCGIPKQPSQFIVSLIAEKPKYYYPR